MWCGTIDSMMLRATVVDVNPQDPTRVWVTIPQKYGAKPLRVFTRVQVTKGDHVYVANTSVTRVPQWVVFDQQTEVGTWGNPYPHTHPIGQVDGLVDWVKEYEAWAKDHAARLDAADKRIAEGKVEVDAARKDLTQAQTDIAEAVRKATLERARLDQAEANLDQMGRNLTAAGGRISANETALKSAQDRLTSAETAVQKTTTDLTAVDTKLTNTSKDLTTLQGTVGDVQSKVVESDRKAAAAQAAADQASTAAGNAASKATAAQSTADQAKAAAGTADEAARAASGLASSKGEVIYQASAPTGARATAQNLWIRTTDNRPHTWNGTAWTPVTDKAATDAAAAAATAQSAASAAQATANQAKADAAAAAQSAASAMTKAGQAQASADGKNTITRSTAPAAQPGTAVGDTHFTMSTMGGGGVVTRQQRWDGSTWQDESVGHQVLASLDLGKATVGELDGIRVKARTIGVNQLTVGLAGNLIVDPNFNDATVSSWRLGGRWNWTEVNGEKCFQAVSNGTLTNMSLNGGISTAPSIPVSDGVTYALTLDVEGYVTIYLRIRYANGAVETPGTSLQNANDSLGRRRVTFTVIPNNYTHSNAAGTKPVEIMLYIRQTPAAPVGSVTSLYSARLAPRTGTVLIEDGAVTGDKVEAQTVAAKVGQFVKVQAANVEVTGDLAARVVNSMDANTKNLVVTESAVLQHTTLLGTTVADQLNVRKLIRGRDAILDGTVDIAQLNVTGAMSARIINTATLAARQGFFTDGLTANEATLLGTTVAEKLVVTDTFSARVVNAMTAQTKNLVVTEDAILNRATVVQSLVTAELITQKADVGTLAANMVAAGAIVSRDSTGSVQITSAGITAQDATPSGTFTRQVKLTPAGLTAGTRTTQTVRIDGQNNWMVGTFSTAENGQRVKISNVGNTAAIDLYASRSTSDHVGVWYDSPDTNVLNSVGRVLAISGSSYTRDSPGLEMWPMRGTFGFRGRWQQETDATKFVEIFNNNGLNAGAWAQIEIPFQSAFPTNNSLLFPLVSAERAAGADVVVMVQSITASSITMVVVNKSNSGNSGAIKLRAAVFNLNS